MITESRKDQIEYSAEAFNKTHPKVWDLFVTFTQELYVRGFRNYSANAVFERIRWETDQADVSGKSEFKLNNNYRAYYARWYMEYFPEHDGFFRTRRRTSENTDAAVGAELTPEDFPYE